VLRINSMALYTARVCEGFGIEHASQDGGNVVMFRNDLERNKEIREARTSVTLSSEPPA
jgi:hypothetical protein